MVSGKTKPAKQPRQRIDGFETSVVINEPEMLIIMENAIDKPNIIIITNNYLKPLISYLKPLINQLRQLDNRKY